MINSYRFFQNKECEYFPCHKTENEEEFNCLFCYCPLYREKKVHWKSGLVFECEGAENERLQSV